MCQILWQFNHFNDNLKIKRTMHTCVVTMAKLRELWHEFLPQSPYFLDSALNDYFLFLIMKKKKSETERDSHRIRSSNLWKASILKGYRVPIFRESANWRNFKQNVSNYKVTKLKNKMSFGNKNIFFSHLSST